MLHVCIITAKRITDLSYASFFPGVFASSKVDSFRPYPYVDTFDFVFLVIQIIWYLVLSYIVFSEVKGENSLHLRNNKAV